MIALPRQHTSRLAQDLRPLCPLGELLPDDRDALARGLREYGWLVPAVALPDGRLIDGAHRVELAPACRVPVIEYQITDDLAYALRFRLNRHRAIPTAPHTIALVERLAVGRRPATLAALLGIPLGEAEILLAARTTTTRRRMPDSYTDASRPTAQERR